MSSALCIVDIVAKAQNVFTKFVCILESCLHLNAVCLSLQKNRLMQHLRFMVQITKISHNSFRFMVLLSLGLIPSFILKENGQLRIQICSLMKTAFYLCSRKSCFFKNLRIRQKIHTGSGLPCTSQLWQKAVLQFNGGNSSFITVMVYIAVPADLNIKICGQCINYRRAHSVKTAACLIGRIVELATCMKGGKHQALCRNALFMHIHRDSSSVVRNCTGTILFQNHMDIGTVACKMLVHRIVHDLINKMIQSLS